jgi:tight adherence protein C
MPAVGVLAVIAAVIVLAIAVRPRTDARRPDAATPSVEDRPEAMHRRTLLAVVIVALAITVLIGPALTTLLTGVAVAWRWRGRQRARADERRAIEAAMPDATELLVACLHAGRSPTQAVLELARLAPLPVRPAFAAVEQRLHRGHGLADALGELGERCGTCALPLVTAISTAVRDGLPLAPVLDRLTDDANASRRRQGEAAARRLPVRLSFPLVVCTLPSFVLLAIAPAILGAVSSLRGSPL